MAHLVTPEASARRWNTAATMAVDPGNPPIADGWYSTLEGVRRPNQAARMAPVARRLPAGVLARLMRWGRSRGAILAAASASHPAVALYREAPGWGTLLWLRALFGRTPKVIGIQYILHRRRHPLRKLLNALDRWATRRALLRGHALARADVPMLAEHYNLPADRFVYVPWPLQAIGAPAELPPAPTEPLVLCAGRAYCDWETVFAAARGAGWPLVVVCGGGDLRRVKRLARGTEVEVLSDIPREQLLGILSRAMVSIVGMKEKRTSQGHIRLADARSYGAAIVASDVMGVADYVEHEQTALLVPPGDPRALRDAVDRLLADDTLRERLRRRAYESTLAYGPDHYLAAVTDLVHGREVRLPAGAPGVAREVVA